MGKAESLRRNTSGFKGSKKEEGLSHLLGSVLETLVKLRIGG